VAKPSKPYSPNEDFAARFVRPRAGRTLIVGSYITEGKVDRRGMYPFAIGVDMRAGPGVDLVLNLEGELPAHLGQFSHIECHSVLEHSQAPWLLAANIERLLAPGGTLDFSVPFVWGLHSYPDDCFRMTATGVQLLFPGIEWDALLYAGRKLYAAGKTPRVRLEEHIYVERTEVLGFGVRR
jgi:SAM-dependent methyltransferase